MFSFRDSATDYQSGQENIKKNTEIDYISNEVSLEPEMQYDEINNTGSVWRKLGKDTVKNFNEDIRGHPAFHLAARELKEYIKNKRREIGEHLKYNTEVVKDKNKEKLKVEFIKVQNKTIKPIKTRIQKRKSSKDKDNPSNQKDQPTPSHVNIKPKEDPKILENSVEYKYQDRMREKKVNISSNTKY